MKVMTENTCDNCDELIHAAVNESDIINFKVGYVKCPNCGKKVLICNECYDEKVKGHYDCGNCPYKGGATVMGMSDCEYVEWMKENEPTRFFALKEGKCGDYYKNLIKEMGIGMKNH